MKRWRGQIDLKAGLAIMASLVAVGSTVWGFASNSGADKQRLAVVEARMERMENTLEDIRARLPPKKR
jgi:uncharacterized protein (UPF0333 family)